jgi:23S rRNA U2552 (ribose-2'-O)-methylase RlmE/FtsJ
MTVKVIKLISRFAMVLIILSIIPSGGFASENKNLTNLTDLSYDPGSCPSYPAKNMDEENFTDIQADMLDSTSKRITELQTLYSEVSKVSNASDLQKVLSGNRQANKNMENNEKHIEPDEMQTEIDEKYGFCLILLENITEENFTDVKAVITDSLQNMTEMTETAQIRLTEGCESSKAEELNEKITGIRDLYTEVNEASTAAELKEILLNHEQAKVLNSVEKKIELLKSRVNESENANYQQPLKRLLITPIGFGDKI